MAARHGRRARVAGWPRNAPAELALPCRDAPRRGAPRRRLGRPKLVPERARPRQWRGLAYTSHPAVQMRLLVAVQQRFSLNRSERVPAGPALLLGERPRHRGMPIAQAPPGALREVPRTCARLRVPLKTTRPLGQRVKACSHRTRRCKGTRLCRERLQQARHG